MKKKNRSSLSKRVVNRRPPSTSSKNGKEEGRRASARRQRLGDIVLALVVLLLIGFLVALVPFSSRHVSTAASIDAASVRSVGELSLRQVVSGPVLDAEHPATGQFRFIAKDVGFQRPVNSGNLHSLPTNPGGSPPPGGRLGGHAKMLVSLPAPASACTEVADALHAPCRGGVVALPSGVGLTSHGVVLRSPGHVPFLEWDTILLTTNQHDRTVASLFIGTTRLTMCVEGNQRSHIT